MQIRATRSLLIAAILAFLATAAHAQGPRTALPEPAPVTILQADALSTPSTTVGIIGSGTNDYRYTGMYIGFGTVGVLAVFGALLCTGQDVPCNWGDYALGTVSAAAVFGLLGAMIGHAIPRQPKVEPVPATP